LLICGALHYIVHEIVIVETVIIFLFGIIRLLVREFGTFFLYFLEFFEVVYLLFVFFNSHSIFFHLFFEVVLISVIIIVDIFRSTLDNLLCLRLFFAPLIIGLF